MRGATVRLKAVETTPEEKLDAVFRDFGREPYLAVRDVATKRLNFPRLAGFPALKTLDEFSYDFAKVEANIKAPIPAEEQKKYFVVPEGFEIELVAADPLVVNPITMALDEKGRLYVSESHTYPYGPPGSPVKPFSNPVIRLDPLPGGKGFKRTVVADGFDDPVMGIAIRDGKLWLTACNLLYQFDLADDGKESGVSD